MKKKVVLMILSILLIGAIAISVSSYTPLSLYARLYAGNHITVNIHATVDGENVFAKKNNVELTEEEQFNYANNNSTLSNKKDYSVLKCRASSYGAYDFYLLIDEKYPIAINMYQWNWWDIQRSDLYIDIDSKNNTVTYYDEYTYLNEQGYKIKSHNEKQSTVIGDSTIIIWAGAN